MTEMRYTPEHCKRYGCYLEHKHPDWSVFDDCFPGKCCISNIDGLTMGGHGMRDSLAACNASRFLLVAEWKWNVMPLDQGQRGLFEVIARGRRDLAIVIVGCPRAMTVHRYKFFSRQRNPQWSSWKKADLESLKRRMAIWSAQADPRRADTIPYLQE